ncbi:hypothetical protein MUK42_32758 [Musa troglodytarum]|uniref:Piwi domain-containing protein n=1 Tax=Musa troglodytarum TaxID=320322 RepID=A0A9E7KGA5_9LILI|nr:hypothetical protein MUK42_32758 [Musa troglodytarum]
MMNKIVVNGGSVNGWMCINFEHNVPEGVACDFCHKLAQMCQISGTVGGSNTVLMDALSKHIPLIRHTIIFGADVTHPHPGEDSSPSIAAVVASQYWPEVKKYAWLVCAQAHRQELIQDLFREWQDPQHGTVIGGMIKFTYGLLSAEMEQVPL